MAVKVETLVIKIAGDAKQFKKELTVLKKGTGDFQDTMKSAAVIGKASFLAIGTAATALGVVATKAFSDFETGLTNVAKTTNLEGKELDDFKQKIIELSEEIPETTDKLLEIATAAGQLGIKGAENLTKFTEVIAKLGRTTDLEGEQAALAIARILNLTNESIDSVDKLGSTLVELGNNFAASESEILEVSKDVAKATVQFKLSSAEILGISAAMASLGIAAEAGGTVVGKAFQSIDKAIRSQGGPAFEKIIELTGMTGDQLTKTFATDASKVFELFIQGLGKAGAKGQDLTAEMGALGLSGIRVNKILPTLAERADILADSMNKAGIASQSAAALNTEAAKAFETTASQLQISQTKVNNTLIALGEQIAPAVIESVGLMADSFKNSRPFIDAIGTALVFVTKGASNFIRTISAAIELGGKNIAGFRKQVKADAKEEENFLLEQLRKRNINENEFAKIQAKNRKARIKNRKKEIEKAEKVVTSLKKKGSDNRVKNAIQEKKRLAQVEKKSLVGIRKVNKAEIKLLKAQQRKASAKEIKVLEKKFSQIKTIASLENDISEAKNKDHLSIIESEALSHNQKLLEIEQAKFDGILDVQDKWEQDSTSGFEDYRDEVEKGFKDDPIIIPTPTTETGDTTTTADDVDTSTSTTTTTNDDGTTTTTIDPVNCMAVEGVQRARYTKLTTSQTCVSGYEDDGAGHCIQKCCSGFIATLSGSCQKKKTTTTTTTTNGVTTTTTRPVKDTDSGNTLPFGGDEFVEFLEDPAGFIDEHGPLLTDPAGFLEGKIPFFSISGSPTVPINAGGRVSSISSGESVTQDQEGKTILLEIKMNDNAAQIITAQQVLNDRLGI